MDLNDIWQEHKTWIIGCFAGLVAFLVGNAVVSSRYDTSGLESRISSARSRLMKTKWYGRAEGSAARADQEALDVELAKVEAKAYFRMRPDYDLAGKDGPTRHYLRQTSAVRKSVIDAMDGADVDFAARQLGLPVNSPVDRQETQLHLVGLDLIEDALTRLLVTSERVREQEPEAVGLRSIEKISIQVRKRKRPSGTGFARRRKQTVDLGQRVGVSIRFRVDGTTLERFLEAMTGGDRALLLEDIDARTIPGEPLDVRCKFLALLTSC